MLPSVRRCVWAGWGAGDEEFSLWWRHLTLVVHGLAMFVQAFLVWGNTVLSSHIHIVSYLKNPIFEF